MKTADRSGLSVMLAAIVSHTLWGLSFMASRTALNTAPVFVLLSHRFLIAFVLMTLLPHDRSELRRISGKQRLTLLLLGLSEPVIYFIAEQYGLLHSNTIFSGVMIALIPVVSTLAAAPLLKERPTARQLIFSLVSMGGVIGVGLLSGSSGTLDAIGILGLTVAVISASGYTLLSRSMAGKVSAYTRTHTMMGLGALIFTALALVQCRDDLSAYVRPLAEPSYLLSMLFLAVFCSVLCYFLLGFIIEKLTVAQETVFSNLTTAVSVFAGAVFLHEPFSWLSLGFCVLILLGIYGVQRGGRTKADSPRE